MKNHFQPPTLANLAKRLNRQFSRPPEEQEKPPVPENHPLNEEVTNMPPAAPSDTITCADCRHARPAVAKDPYCWHHCVAGVERGGGWGMAKHHCPQWEVAS